MPSDNSAHSEALVSVICRSVGREELKQTLQSVAEQSHPAIELILVDAAATDLTPALSDFSQLNCTVVSTGSPLKRSAAANAGLEAAQGDWLLMLDDDDWIAADHITSLLQALQGNDEYKAAYSNVQKTDAQGNALDYRFDQSFDPVLLMRDNYIPIHAMLFQSSLINAGCRFDEQFDIYEDWDFWLQLSEHTSFLHVDKVTAFYRQGGESDTDVADAGMRYRNDNAIGQARARLFSKWVPKWTGEQVNALLGSLDQSELVTRLANDLESEHQTNLEHQAQIKALLQDLESVRSHLAATNSKYDHAVERIQSLEAHIDALQRNLDEVFTSTSWKLTAPVRSVGRLLKSQPDSTDSPEDKS